MNRRERAITVIERRAVRRVAVLACVILFVVGSLSLPATYALLFDQDRSAANALRATSADVKLSEVGPATQNSSTDETLGDGVRDTWEDYSHENGSGNPVQNTLEVENPDTRVDVSSVTVTVSYVENDTSLLEDGDSGTTAETLNVSTITYDGADKSSDVTDVNGNGFKDIDDLSRQDVELGGVPANGSGTLTVEIAGDASLSASIGGDDGVDFTLHLTMTIDPSWDDVARSTNNTIQYEST